jgi:hypothetical protein
MPFRAGNDRADAISGKAKQGFPKAGTGFEIKTLLKLGNLSSHSLAKPA